MFAAHFPFIEFQRRSDRPLGSQEIAYAEQLSHRLEAIRAQLGGTPLVITSFVRTDSVVRTTGQRSQHADGSAVDVRRPLAVSWSMLAELAPLALRNAGHQWGQFIIYPHEGEPGHFHLSLPTGSARGAILAQAAGGSYVPFGSDVLAGVPETPAGAPSVESVAGVVIVGALVLSLVLWVNA
jgi:hypothetical protein